MRNKSEIRNAVKFCLILPVLLAVIFPFLGSSAEAQGKKTTATPTVTRTSTLTPTMTSTDSLNVFETPNTPTTDPLAIYISEPIDGSTLSGVVEIKGKTAVLGFSHQDVEFSYQVNPTDTWFILTRSDQGVRDGSLALWDTKAISDGDYVIRLRVFFSDGSWRDTFTKGLKVRNYTATQTVVSTATQKTLPTSPPSVTNVPTSSPSPQATPTALPGNGAELPSSQIWASLEFGAATTVILFIFFGLLLKSRKKSL